MTFEVEQKFPVPDHSVLLAKLSALAATRGEPIEQIDTYYAHPTRDFAKTDEALRIRRAGGDNFLTYKGPKLDVETKTRREIEIPLAPGESAAASFGVLLEALGFSPVATVRKIRTLLTAAWQGQSVEVALDDVDGLGTFVELELTADEAEVDAARDAILSLASELGLGSADHSAERRSYLELLLERATAPEIP